MKILYPLNRAKYITQKFAARPDYYKQFTIGGVPLNRTFMNQHMFAWTNHLKISNPIVSFVSIFVVYIFKFFKFSFNIFRHFEAVFFNIFSIYTDKFISSFIYNKPISSFIKTFKRAVLGIFSNTRPKFKFFATHQTIKERIFYFGSRRWISFVAT